MNKIGHLSSQIFNKQSQLSQDLLCTRSERISAAVKKIFLSLAQFIVSSFVFVLVAPLGLITTSPKIKACAAILFDHIKSGFRNFFFGCSAITTIPTEDKVLNARLAEEKLKARSARLILESTIPL